jgi:hypothetical protein
MPSKNFPDENMPAKVDAKGYPQKNLDLSLKKNFIEQSKMHLDEAFKY